MTPHIVIVSPDFPPVFGGVSDYTYQLANALAKKCKISVLTSANRKIQAHEEKNIHILPVVHKWNVLHIKNILNYLDSINTNTVIFQYVPYLYSKRGIPFSIPLILYLLRRRKINIVTTMHEYFIDTNWKNPKYVPFALSMKLIFHLIVSLSQKIVVSNDYLLKNFPKYTNIEKIIIGSNILPIPFSTLERAQWKQKIAPHNEKIIATFGAFRDKMYLLQVLNKVIAHFPCKLLMIGHYPIKIIEKITEEAVRLNIKDHIIVTGYLNTADIYRHLKLADLFVHIDSISNNRGGLTTKSGAVAAGFAAGLPILGIRGNLTDDFFQDKENCLIAPEPDIDDICCRICDLFDNPTLNKNLRKKAQETYENYIDWQVIADKYLNIIGV